MPSTLAEAVTESFYAWEIRGRGWMLSDYPVVLEPPFRPCFLLPGLRPAALPVIDDGARPTITSSIISGVKNLIVGRPKTPAPDEEPFEEPSPARAVPAEALVSLRVTVPAEYKSRPDVMAQLLRSLSTTFGPVAFEIIGTAGTVHMQITVADVDAEFVAMQMSASIPEAVVVEAADVLYDAWDDDCEQLVVDFGLADEFFLPIATLESRLDPYVALVPALARTGNDELLAVQILFEGVRNRWAAEIRDAIDDGEGHSIIEDAPEFIKLSGEKLGSPLFAACARVASQAKTEGRAWDLATTTGAFIRQCGRPGANELIPLRNDGYADGDHAISFLRRETFRSGMILSGDELAQLVHLPDESVRHARLARSVERTKAAPEDARGKEIVLGQNVDRGVQTLATVSDVDRLSHCWVVGASGAGKSTLLLSLILQDIARGRGVAVLDPHGDLIDDTLARIPADRADDVIVFDPSDMEWPIGLNILKSHSEIEKTLLASDIVGVFRRLSTSWGDTMSSVLANATLAFLESSRGGTLLDLRRFLVDDRYRKDYLTSVDDEEVRFFWEREYALIGSRSIGPILTRLDTFLRSKVIRQIVGQKDGRLDLGSVLSGRKILLVKLAHGAIGEENSYLLGSLLIGKLLELVLARQDTAKSSRENFFLYVDEFQHFLTPTLETLLTAARKYGLGVTLAHQTLSQLGGEPRVLAALQGNAHTRVVFRASEDDARKLADGLSYFEEEDVLRLRKGEAIIRLGSSQSDFNVQTFPPSRIDADESAERIANVLERSRQRYAVPAADVLAALRAARDEIRDPPDTPTTAEAPASARTPQEPSSAPPSERQSPPEPKPRVQRPPMEDREPAPMGRGGEEHKYLQHLVKRLAEERGFRAIVEDGAGTGRADVVIRKNGRSAGFEISVTTDVDHEIQNVRKCLAAGLATIYLVVKDKRRRDRLTKRLAEEKLGATVVGIDDIIPVFDQLDAGSTTTESTVRGYKVKVKRQQLDPADVSNRRSAVAEVIARSLHASRQ